MIEDLRNITGIFPLLNVSYENEKQQRMSEKIISM